MRPRTAVRAALACALLGSGLPALGSEPAFPSGQEHGYGQALLPWELAGMAEEETAAYRQEIGAARSAAERRAIVERWRGVMESRDRGRLFLTIPSPMGPRDTRAWRGEMNRFYAPWRPGNDPESAPGELPMAELRPYLEELPQTRALREQERLEEQALESLFPQASERALVKFLLYSDGENFEENSRLLIAAGAKAAEDPERQTLAADWRRRALAAAEAQLQAPQRPLDRFLQRRGIDPNDLAELLLSARRASAPPAAETPTQNAPAPEPAATREEAAVLAGAPFDGNSAASTAPPADPGPPADPEPSPAPAQDPAEISPEPAPMDIAGAEAFELDPAPADQGEPDKVEDPDRWNPAINGAKWALWGGMIGFILGGPAGMLLLMAAAFVLGWTIGEETA